VRPIYETSFDIGREAAVATLFAEANDMAWVRNPSKYPIDISFTEDNQIVLFGEIKCRKVKKDTYPTYMLSVSKVIAAKALTDATGVECLLIVDWKDTSGWINLSDKPDSVGFGGRTDRGDRQDVEPVVYFNIDRFIVF
tara:strand:- start:908 stop:1324 length:417 start_codon:yes stop_codon:yes gene_type:complete